MMPQTPTALEPELEYPDCDGQPMSDNTLQFRWIVTIQGNLDGIYRDNPNVFVAGDLLWYPVKGQPAIRLAPDTLVAFGRPKGYRGSYIQWREDDIAPQVVFEIRSPKNTDADLDNKRDFYDRYQVEEYYLYDPDFDALSGWRRVDGRLQPIPVMHNWQSSRLGIRFDLSGEELVIYRPDGQPFFTFIELLQQKEQAERAAAQDRAAKEQAKKLAEQERAAKEEAEQLAQRERTARQQMEQVAAEDRRSREAAQRRAQELAERLRSLGIDPES